MKRQKLSDALNEIDDAYIAKAAKSKKRIRKRHWFSAAAAVLAIAIAIYAFAGPGINTAHAVSVAKYSERGNRDFEQTRQYARQLSSFFTDAIAQVLLDGDSSNHAFSPANLYMALAITAELTGGNEQILDTLGASDLSTLRSQASTLWSTCYNDSNNQCLLANSLWLDKDLSYQQEVMDTLASYYFTSVYQGNFGSAATNRSISAWLNQQTGNLLKDSANNISLDPSTVFALYATVYYQAKWSSEFDASANTRDVFHAPSGDRTVTYMHKENSWSYYYWGEDFGAISLSLKDGSQMWLILPDEDKTVEDVLSAGEYASFVFGTDSYESSKYVKVNLSLPKFDIRDNGDLTEDLKALGITDVFDESKADFSALWNDGPVYLTKVNQATRVAIDEKGVTAASYVEFPGATSPAPPEEEIDFILDRPFLFIVTSSTNIPLFAGTVTEP